MNRRVLVALSITGLVVAGAVTYVLVGGSATSSGSAASPGQVHTLALRTMSDTEPTGSRRPVMGLPAETTKPFSMLGVSWDDTRVKLDGGVQVRTRGAATGRWSPWQSIKAGSGEAPDSGTRSDRPRRGATEPLWVGPSNGVQVRVTGKHNVLPKGLRVDLVDPGDGKRRPGPRAAANAADEMALVAAASTADPSSPPASSGPSTPAPTDSSTPTDSPSPSADPSTSPSASTSPSPSAAPTATDPTSTAPRPSIVSRAGWVADETLVKSAPEYAPEVKVVFTHHTAGSNTYTCDQSPAIVRSIMLYHVKTLGWNDIGYNFLVDKCGTIFEGRAGGADKAVIGAQTYGFNTGSSGVSVLGNYSEVTPTSASLNAVAKIAAWKLGLTGTDPTGKAVLTTPINNGKYAAGTSVTFNTIAMHRDAYATECPGTLFYDKLDGIRTQAKQWTTPVTSLSLTGIAGATKVATTYYTKGTVTLSWPPAAASGYQVLVDNTVVARPAGTATTARITLAAGSHKLQLRAINIDGTTVSSPTYPIIADATAPIFSTPATLTLRTGTVSPGGYTPVRLGWKATDNTLLQTIKATSPAAKTFTTTTTAWYAYAKPNTSLTWSLTATDAATNTRTSAVTRTTSVMHEYSSTRTGTWRATSSSYYVGGNAYYSGVKGATASYTFTGRAVGLIFKRATNLGAAYIYIDGIKVAYIDTRASSTALRQLMWTKHWSTSTKHTIKIVVAGTTGRPYVVTDGITYIK